MKKIIIFFLSVSAFALKAQTPQNLTSNGNSFGANDFAGTTNQQNFVIKSGNQKHTVFQTDGDLKILSLQGTGNRLVYSTANGALKTYPLGQPGQLLTADGIWVDPPANYWQLSDNGNKISTSQNKVGINFNNPNNVNFTLDVNGDGRFSGNLVLNGELIINEKITSPKQLKAKAIEVDSIKMDSGKAIYGETTVKGDVKLKNTLDVTGDATFNGSQSILGNQFIQGSQDVNGTLIARQGILFNGTDGLRYTPATGTTKAIYTLGNGSTTLRESICVDPDQNQWLQMYGGYISRSTGSGTNQVNSSLTMMSAPWDGNGVIEVEGVGPTGQTNNALMINYFCGRNTLINCNNGLSNRGGQVIMGEQVSMAKNVGIGYAGIYGPIASDVSLNIFTNEDNQTALKLNVWNGTVKAIDVVNPGNNVSNFTVMQNGDATVGGALKMKQFDNGSGNTVAYFDAAGNLKQGNGYNTVQSACVSGADSWHIGGDNIAGMTAGDKAIGTCDNEDFMLKANGTRQVWVKAGTGAVGIGTNLPSGRLTVKHDGIFTGPAFFMDLNSVGFVTHGQLIEHKINNDNFKVISVNYNPGTGPAIERFSVTGTGKVRIGDKKVTSGNYANAMLSVYGTIAATEVQVFNNSWWADYVFEKDYKLMPLSDVENFYKENKHLPNVPSKKEVEENGTNLAEIDATLLRKIEENTLYLVELNKKIEVLIQENSDLKTKVKELEKK